MLDRVGNPEDRLSHNTAHKMSIKSRTYCLNKLLTPTVEVILCTLYPIYKSIDFMLKIINTKFYLRSARKYFCMGKVNYFILVILS